MLASDCTLQAASDFHEMLCCMPMAHNAHGLMRNGAYELKPVTNSGLVRWSLFTPWSAGKAGWL